MNIMGLVFAVLSAIIGYLFGCIPVGVLVAKLYAGTDIRKTGSGNTGTTNVLRTLGWVPSVLTLAGDCLKGVLGALIGKYLGGEVGMVLGGFFAVLGHDFPVFSRFKGGKGIATSLGMILVISPLLAVSLLAVEIIIVAVTGYMSVASITAAIEFSVLMVILNWNSPNKALFIAFALVYSALALFAHRANIQRLLSGTENKLDFAKINKLSSKKKDK